LKDIQVWKKRKTLQKLLERSDWLAARFENLRFFFPVFSSFLFLFFFFLPFLGECFGI